MLSVEDLRLRLPDCGLHDVTLEVAAGECLCIMGPTGAGKTVLLEAIAGIRRPDAGCVRLAGADVTRLPAHARGIAYVPQDGALFPHLTVADNVAYGLVERREPTSVITERVAHAAALLGVDHLLHRRPAYLSGGEAQRVALARALVMRAGLLLLDEPFAAVDERNRERLGTSLRDLREQWGTAVVHVSHSLEEALALGDRICVLKAGRVMQTAPTDDLLRRPACEFVATFTGCRNVVPGEVVLSQGQAWFQAAGLRLQVARCDAGKALLVIRPEDIRLHGAGQATGLDLLPGQVTHVTGQGALWRADVRAGGVEWAVLASRREAEALELAAGKAVRVELPSEVLHIIARDGTPGA